MTGVTQVAVNPLKQAIQFGQSIWYDGLVPPKTFREMIVRDGLRGATTNPTIFEKAIASGEYDAKLRDWFSDHRDEEIYEKIAVKAVQQVADEFRPLYNEIGGGDGYVSIEVSPFLAYETEATIREAMKLWLLTARPNVMIKIPATAQGIPAIEQVISEGINVNVTLIFSVNRYREVMNAYLSGLEKRVAAGKPVNTIASVASFFVSRVDSAVDKVLDEKGGFSSLKGQIAIANSRHAYAEFEKIFSSERFTKLRAKGAKIQRPLWASTGTKNPAYSDVLYVEQLMGPDTVDTIPPATMDAFRDHGKPASRLKNNMPKAMEALSELARAGINLEKVTEDLEKQGVELFNDSYRKILKSIGDKRNASKSKK